MSYAATNSSPGVFLSARYRVTRASGEKSVVKIRGNVMALPWKLKKA